MNIGSKPHEYKDGFMDHVCNETLNCRLGDRVRSQSKLRIETIKLSLTGNHFWLLWDFRRTIFSWVVSDCIWTYVVFFGHMQDRKNGEQFELSICKLCCPENCSRDYRDPWLCRKSSCWISDFICQNIPAICGLTSSFSHIIPTVTDITVSWTVPISS